jgi:hypothetical protein
MNLLVFTLQKNIMFDDFPDFCRYQWLHYFLMSFGIEFGSILGAFWDKCSCFFVIVFWMNIRCYFLQMFDQKGSQIILLELPVLSLFGPLSARAPFYNSCTGLASILAHFWLHLGRFGHPLDSMFDNLFIGNPPFLYPNLKSTCRQPQTPSSKEFHLLRPRAELCRRQLD